jgi:hypothetical protein
MQKLILAFALVGLAGAARAANPPQPPRSVEPVPPPQTVRDPGGPWTPPSTPEPLTMGALALGGAGVLAWKLKRRKT